MDLSDLINVMVQQELSIYKTQDYLQPEFQEKIALQSVKDFPMLSNFSVGSSSSSSSSPINEFWREKICEWSFQVVDHFSFSREVVCVSIHMLDRFLSTRSVDKNTFQLAAMTTLFVSIKLSEPGRLSMRSMIELSRGYFKVEQMAAMEMTILRSLSWQIHPPTAYCFLKHLLFLPTFHCVPMEMRYDVLELSRFLTELSVMDYFFVIYRPSSVAIAALLIAMEANPGVTRTRLSDFSKEIGKLNHLDTRCKEVLDCRNRIRLLYVDGGYAENQAIRAQESRTETISPVCVSYGCTTYPDFA